MNSNVNKGFTLIELLITMVIIGLLARLAYPSYQTWVMESRRTDAMAMLTQDQALIERCYAQTFAYNKTCTTMPTFPQASTQGYYTITLSNLTATTYTLTATAIGTQVKDTKCLTMSIDQANQKTALDSGGTSQSSCWTP